MRENVTCKLTMQLIQYLAIILLIYLDFLRIAVKRILFG